MSYQAPQRPTRSETQDDLETEIAIPLRLKLEGKTLSFLSTTTVFGTPHNVALSEIALETFFPADTETFKLLKP